MSTDEMIAVIQAYNEGKKIQARAKQGEPDHALGWHDVHPNFDFYRCDFRVKPEPREFYLRRCQDDVPNGKLNVYTERSSGWCSRCEVIRVREVLD